VLGAATDIGFDLITEACRAEGIKVPIFTSEIRMYKVLLAYTFGFLPFMHVEADAFSLPWMTRNYE